MSDPRTIRCGSCGQEFVTHRVADEDCVSCRTAPTAVDFEDHRLDVIASNVSRGVLADVLAALEAEGFVVGPPGSALVPSDWLLGLQSIIDPEFDALATTEARIQAEARSSRSGRARAFDGVRDHVRKLAAVRRITTVKGA